jgi:hypothetical protein
VKLLLLNLAVQILIHILYRATLIPREDDPVKRLLIRITDINTSSGDSGVCVNWKNACLFSYIWGLSGKHPAILNISRVSLVARCNLAASQKRPYCVSVNSHSPVGLVSRQWDPVDWACVMCDRRIHNDRASRSVSSRQCACPLHSSRVGFSGKASHHPGLSAPLQPTFGFLQLLAFPKAKIAVERRRSVNMTVTQYTSSVNGVSLPID